MLFAAAVMCVMSVASGQTSPCPIVPAYNDASCAGSYRFYRDNHGTDPFNPLYVDYTTPLQIECSGDKNVCSQSWLIPYYYDCTRNVNSGSNWNCVATSHWTSGEEVICQTDAAYMSSCHILFHNDAGLWIGCSVTAVLIGDVLMWLVLYRYYEKRNHSWLPTNVRKRQELKVS